VRPPGKYDELRQSGQQAEEASAATPQSEAAAQLDSAQDEPTRPTRHPRASADYTVEGAPVVPQNLAEMARAAKEREDAAVQSKEQDKGKGGR